MQRTGYDTDLTDAQWAWVAPILEAKHSPEHWNREHSLRALLDALFYRLRTGCQWRNLPNDLPPWSTVHAYYRQWRKNGLLDRLHAALREAVRAQEGHAAQPTAGSLDSQTVKSTEKGGARARLGMMGPRG
jgi:putative transposase